ncbi:hypothetical protein Tco_0731085 [Tanacetum coccineum]
MSTTRQGLNFAAIKKLIAQCMDDAMIAYEANRNSGNGLNNETSSSVSGVEHIDHGCSYKEFLTCKPYNFNGTKGAISLTRWSYDLRLRRVWITRESGRTTKDSTLGNKTRGADRSFVSTAFSPLINIAPTTLDVKYTIELADGKLVGSDTIIRGMDWLSKYHAVIVCDEKLSCLPYSNEPLTIQGDRSESRLNIISCIKTHKYIQKGFHVFLAHIKENKLEEKQLEDVPVLRNFLEVFLEDLPGLPPTRQVEL